VTARSAAERARAWRERQHTAALNDVLGLLATLPEVAIAEGLRRLTTGQLRLLGDHLVTVSVRQARRDLEQDPVQGRGSVRAGANGDQVDPPASRLTAGMTKRGRTVIHDPRHAALQGPAGRIAVQPVRPTDHPAAARRRSNVLAVPGPARRPDGHQRNPAYLAGRCRQRAAVRMTPSIGKQAHAGGGHGHIDVDQVA
jgi:hypothetical protein